MKVPNLLTDRPAYLAWLDAEVVSAIHDGPLRSRDSLIRHFHGHDRDEVDCAISNALANSKAYQHHGLIRANRS